MLSSLTPIPDLLDAFYQHQARSYLAATTASLLAYDILLGLFEDIRILSIRSPKLPDLIYILSRIFAIGLATANCIFQTSPQNSCIRDPVLTAVGVFTGVLVPCNSWLFLLRVRAIPPQFRSSITLTVCTILWLSTFTSFLTILAFKNPEYPSQDGNCELTDSAFVRWLIFAPFIALVAFDTVSMMAILAGFATIHTRDSSWIARIKSAVTTKHMGHLSRVFVRSGLIYYLATIGIHLTLAALLSQPSTIPIPVLGSISFLAGIFHNIMTCRVFRLLKLEVFDYSNRSFSLTTDRPTTTGMIVFRNTASSSS